MCSWVDLAVPAMPDHFGDPTKLAGSAEVQRLAQGPVKGRNWVGSFRLLNLSCWLGILRSTQKQELTLFSRSELRQGHPLNLSISISGGKETNKDSPSSGERNVISPT